MAGDSYVIRGGRDGYARLALLHRMMAPFSTALFDRVGFAPGMRCLDVGCGGGATTRDIARRIGPSGAVLGVDIDATKIDLARADAAAEDLSQARFAVIDLLSETAEAAIGGGFDRIYARFLLSHLTRPAAALARMARLLAPGGVLLVEDVDFSAPFCRPHAPAFDRFVALYRDAARARGAHPDIGPDLPGLLLQAGLGRVDLHVVQPAALRGETKLLVAVTMDLIADAAIASGLSTRQEVETVSQALHALAADETTVMSHPRMVQAWGHARS